MLNYICFTIITITIHLFIKYDYPKYFYDLSIIKYNKWKSLNGLVSSKYKSYLNDTTDKLDNAFREGISKSYSNILPIRLKKLINTLTRSSIQ